MFLRIHSGFRASAHTGRLFGRTLPPTLRRVAGLSGVRVMQVYSCQAVKMSLMQEICSKHGTRQTGTHLPQASALEFAPAKNDWAQKKRRTSRYEKKIIRAMVRRLCDDTTVRACRGSFQGGGGGCMRLWDGGGGV